MTDFEIRKMYHDACAVGVLGAKAALRELEQVAYVTGWHEPDLNPGEAVAAVQRAVEIAQQDRGYAEEQAAERLHAVP